MATDCIETIAIPRRAYVLATQESPPCPHRWKWQELGRRFEVLLENRDWKRASALVEEAKKFWLEQGLPAKTKEANLLEPLAFVLDNQELINRLEEIGCVYVRDLIAKSQSDIFELPGMGLLKINYLTLMMQRLGLKWPTRN